MSRRLTGLALAAVAAAALVVAPVGPGGVANAAVGKSAAATAAVIRAAARVPVPPVPKNLPGSIEDLAGYVGQTSCDPRIRPGTRALAKLLARTYSAYGATSWSSTYQCGTDGGQSEHYDGRAIDWMVDIHDVRQHAAAKAFLAWLLGTDGSGNRYAMARRLGVMYVIYDNRMWGGWSGQWEPYDGCARRRSSADDNTCHRTHLHISLSWNGAMGRTTYWTERVAPTDFGPCRAPDLNWAFVYRHANLRGCPGYRTVSAARGASATKRALVTYSGAAVRRGSSGPAVSAVQGGLRVARSGSFGAGTAAAVRALQRRHHLRASGTMTPSTWRALLADVG